MYTLEINRYKDNGKQTDGYALLYDDAGNIIYSFLTLELPWKDNKNKISCIPADTYIAHKHHSPKFGEALWIKDVSGRSEILIHPANYFHQLLGCIAPGSKRIQIDSDGQLDVSNSRNTMQNLLSLIPTDTIIININQNNC